MCYIDPLCDMEKAFVRKVSSKQSTTSILSECFSSIARRFPPDGLLTSEQAKHDVELNPHIIEPDPFASDDCFNDFSPVHQFLLKTAEEENTMNSGADDLSSGLNGRLRPRKSNIPSPQSTKLVRKSDGKTGQDKVKRTGAASKTPPNKTDDLSTKSDSTYLCPYCDKHFASKQTLSKHVRRIHGASSKQDSFIACMFCSHYEAETNEIIRHMAGTHPQQYFACLNCHTRFSSSCELAEHKIKSCDNKLPYRSRLRQKVTTGSLRDTHKDDFGNEGKVFQDGQGFNGIVISCELKPSQVSDGADIEDNITTNLILPPSKNLGSNTVIEKNAVIVLDDIQWNKRIPPNFSFHNTDADQILSRLGVVHRSPRAGESTKKDWKNLDETTQKFEKCFDTSFYSKVASNVQENLSKFLDGSFNFNPDPDSTIKTRKSKNSVVINTAEGFPILLASEQFSRNLFDRYMPRAIAPKHKWKWDNLETEKHPINPDQIKRDSHTNNCIISLVSSLDIWTQLRMRRKFEEKFGCPPLEKKTEKQTIISNELKDILESRELPTPSKQVLKMTRKPAETSVSGDFPSCLGLMPSTSAYEPQPAVLSGEWVRPRCYVCCACGAQSRDSRAVSAHVSTQHPNAQVQHYEIVGEQLLNADIVKHLYVPPSQMCNRTRPPRGFRECTKCRKSITLDDLHQHMLDCAGDTPAVRRKCRYRPFGVRRRRPRLPDNTIRKKIRKDIRSRQTRPKALMRPRPIRTEVGDAETIRKMIADLPAKRHRVLVNPTNPSLRPRIKQRPKILMKRRSSEDRNKRKKRNNKESSEIRLGSPVNDGTAVLSDDDNKPLKPEGRRVASKTPRRSESDKRKATMLTRAKRPNRQVKKVIKNDNIKDTTMSGGNSETDITENLSIENSPKKLDINAEDFKAKEHAGQGQRSSNNRDGQRPGGSGQNANSNNRCAPAQNVPLKHSIARLTADSEKHDKSVQFHHLFLVQQECNNANQHMQSGQQLLFENEAAVLTLDKPPLHHNTKGSLDALLKSKLNKPRKGLNACIAMLKNKLVEPSAESAIPAGHVSVQCGDDEPLYVKPDAVTLTTPVTLENNVEITEKSEIVHDTNQDKTVPLEIKTRHLPNRVKINTHTEVKTRKISPTPCELIAPDQKQQKTETKRESGRRRSLVIEDKAVKVPLQPALTSQANVSKVAPGPVSPKLDTVPRPISPKATSVTDHTLSQKEVKQQTAECNKSKRRSKATDISKDIQHAKPNKKQPSIQQLPENNSCTTLLRQSSDEKQTMPEKVPELIKPNITTQQPPANEKEQIVMEQSNAYYGNRSTLQQQADYHSDCEYSRKVNVDNFPSPDFNHVPVNNQPAHASTHVESIVSIPLDLSGKVTNVNTAQDLLNSQNPYLLGSSYDTYETLDLSNKGQDLNLNDEIVDLSIKTSHMKSIEIDDTGEDTVTDLSLKSSVSIDVPTDLTVKKTSTDQCGENPDVPDRGSLRRKEVKKLDKLVKSQVEGEIGHMTSPELNKLDPKATSLSLAISTEDLNIPAKVINSKEASMPPSKSGNVVPVIPENAPEKNIVNVPADLSCQQRNEDTLKDVSAPCQVSVSLPKLEHDAYNKNEENASQTHPRICEKTSIQAQKPIYDPTLKIPQYKIRAASSLDNASGVGLSSNTSPIVNITPPPKCPLVSVHSEAGPNLTQDISAMTPGDKPFAYGALPFSAPNSNPGCMYAITNCGITAHLNKFESTTPVYTLATACISVTKIESSNSTTLTNTLLSIPGSTIANTTPVYTLAGTTIGMQANYSHIVPSVPSNSTIQKNDDCSVIPTTSSQGSTQNEKELNTPKEKVNSNLLLNVDQDPETARKIALLPKELVDVLGNMPVDHRNKLLNILPQYVSTPMSDSGLKCDPSNQSDSTGKLTTSSEPTENKIPSVEITPESETKTITPLFIAQEESKILHMSNNSTHVDFENTSTMPPLVHPTSLSLHRPINPDDSASNTDESHTTQTNRHPKDELKTEVQIKSDVISEDSFSTMASNRLTLCHNLSADKVIDLTEDETVSPNETQNEPIIEVPPVSIHMPLKRNKSNNDQTASLRAVRIKAPSARQKSIDSQLVKYSLAPVLSNKLNNNEQNNEVEKSVHVNVSLNTDISLAIQQAEVSSTQHSNKTVVAECKFPSLTSPNIQESNLDETNNCSSRRLSTASKDENIKIDDLQNVKSFVKATLVTSSIVNNEINKEPPEVISKKCSSLNSDLSDTKYISMTLDVSSESSETAKNNSATLTDSIVQSDLDVSESYDLPIQCSTPNSKIMMGKQTERPTLTDHCRTIAIEDQEDSDDDLSLAVICKQKRQNLLKTDSNDDINKSNKETDTAIRRRDKKSKKNVENINTARASSLRTINTMTVALKKDKQINLTDMGELSSSKLSKNEKRPTTATVDDIIKKNNRKLRRKKGESNEQSNIGDVVAKVVLNECDINNVTVENYHHIEDQRVDNVKENDFYKPVLKDDNKQSINTSRKRSKLNDGNVISETLKEQCTEASPLKQKSKKKKKTAIERTDSVNCEISSLSSNLEQKIKETTIPSSIGKNIISDQNPSICESTNLEEIRLIDKPENISNDSSHSTETNNAEHATPPIASVPLTSCSSLEDTSNIKPLRRSKRRGSRNNSVAGEESLHTEPLQENRTPLTKKQLIFSKLLLDEENNIKNPDGVTDDKVDDINKTPAREIVKSDVTTEPAAMKNIIKETSKSVKRKKSPHLKRKCKKKKSLTPQVSCEESVDSVQDQAKDSAIAPQEEQQSSSDNSENHAPSTSNSTRLSSTDTQCIQSNGNSSAIYSEKRKSGDLPHVDLSQSFQPKKCKLNMTECGSDENASMKSLRDENNTQSEKDILMKKHSINVPNDVLDSTRENDKNMCDQPNNIIKTAPVGDKPTGSKLNENDLRMKTCYNMPVAGRRTRSKSAVIKSAVYDPYDIDMDDMIEHAEPLRQLKTSSDFRPPNKMAQSKVEENLLIDEEDDIKKSHEPTKHTMDTYSKHDLSDSDDSSKSDVPLKKYVEEKERKTGDLDEVTSIHKIDVENEVCSNTNSDNNQSSSYDRKNRRTLGLSNSDAGIAQDEKEQQLRSEQFMESFGFFSERKPRKSNLLATKKISETFHIANESDDMYFGSKDRTSKKITQNENRKSAEMESNVRGTRQRSPLSKKSVKRGRKKKISTTVTTPSYCHICKKEFRRSDNFLRHQMTLLHVSKMSEVEMKIKTIPVLEEPNYLIAYKEHLDRLKIITDKMLKRKKNSKSTPKIAPLSLEEILADVNKIVREQQLSHRGLSCDEELFLDCCELLKESHKKQDPVQDISSLVKDSDHLCSSQPSNVGLDLLGKTDVDVKSDNKNDGDVDSLTAKTILESEEVRNLENDLISGLKEAANASNLKNSGIVFQHAVNEVDTDHQEDFSDQFSSPPVTESHYEHLNNFEETVELNSIKNKKYPEFKEKMYPDIEEIDMFEDKFDKIKRKCRSQAAAAKQPQLVIEPSISRKGRKKSEKKKGKKNSKKNHPNTVLTKGALKGFDGIKVSIPTSDINISAIVSPLENTHKKKKKSSSKKRRENKISESSSKYDSDHPLNDNSASHKNVDVYEFMDNEDVELFEFRPSTLMERFKSISNKDIPSTSKANPVVEEADNSSASASDGDDFVYMSDDYVCSDDETENSLMSCDVSNTKISTDSKKLSTQLKKRDAIEKNAVMGKIFKNNAVRSEKKITKNKEPAKPKANLDQLFDSLLEDEPSSSMLNDESLSLKDDTCSSKYENRISSPSCSDEVASKYEQYHIKKKYNLSTDKENLSKYKSLSSDIDEDDDDDDDDDEDDDDDDDHVPPPVIDYGPSTSKLCLKSFIGDHKSTKPSLRPSLSPPELKPVSPKKSDYTASKQHLLSKKNEKKSTVQDDFVDYHAGISKNGNGMKKCESKSRGSPARKIGDDTAICGDYNEIGDQLHMSDETGVARQRARRKCTVGKQNILAETWSSESEPDGGPPRPNSAESMASGSTRKKKGKKKDGQHTVGRRTNNRHISFKKQENESRVTSSNRNITTYTSGASSSGIVDNRSTGGTLGSFVSEISEPSASAGTNGGACEFVDEPPPTPSTSSGASSMLSTSTSPFTSTGGAAVDPADPAFLVPAEPGTSGALGRARTVYYWSSEGGATEQAREALAREEQARQEQAREEQARQELAREELARQELARAEQARQEREREEREREEREREEREREEHAREEEAQQQQQQQHGWIVGDSHKKLVTMLAHAKGRKRNNNDDKRHKTE